MSPQHQHVSRRTLLKAGAASGALLLASPTVAHARGTRTPRVDPARRSKLFPREGRALAHADLHNHTLLSDGKGMAEGAFASMRANGLDVAAITDHAGIGKLQGDTCQGCAAAIGIDESEWRRLAVLADGANVDGSYVAMRGFEWSSPTLGHVNVWQSQTWTDPLATGGVGGSATAASFAHEGSTQLPAEAAAEVDAILRSSPEGEASMTGFYGWLKSDPGRPVTGRGSDAFAGFNHPGREEGRFGGFTFDPMLQQRIVSLELFNRGEDYLFEGVDAGAASPLVECLDAGWKVGVLGVSDEHGTRWGEPEGKGRTGLWTSSLTRAGVREAMLGRRFFATRERGLRLDASAQGLPMGADVGHAEGPISFGLDIDRGAAWVGLPLRVQVLQTGRPLPTVVHEVDVTVPAPDAPPIRFSAPVSRANGAWVVLRVTDPALPADSRAPAGSPYAAAGSAVAYASPFFLVAAPPPAPTPPKGNGKGR